MILLKFYVIKSYLIKEKIKLRVNLLISIFCYTRNSLTMKRQTLWVECSPVEISLLCKLIILKVTPTYRVILFRRRIKVGVRTKLVTVTRLP